MFNNFYRRILRLSEQKYATQALSCIAFLESIIFPIPPDVILVPMSLAQKRQAFFFATLTTIFSVLGGVVSYLIGSIFWIEIGEKLIASLGYQEAYSSFENLYNKHGMIIVIFGALSPFPFKIIAILSGVLGYSLTVFFLTATISRGLRFFIIAGVIFYWGDQINYFLNNYFGILCGTLTLVFLGAYLFI